MSASEGETQRHVRWIMKGGLGADDDSVGAAPTEIDLNLFLENGGGVLEGFGVEPFEIDAFQSVVATM